MILPGTTIEKSGGMCSNCGVLVCYECKDSLVMSKNKPCPRCKAPFHVYSDVETVKRLEAMFEQRRSFSMRCSREGCTGYLNTQWKCALCNWVTCSSCLTPAGKSKAECGRHRCAATGAAGGGLVASGI